MTQHVCAALLFLTVPASATEPVAPAKVTSLIVRTDRVTLVHLRPDFESIIRLPEPVTSVLVGNPDLFQTEHSEGEPDYVYVHPNTRKPSQSNLLIATQSGLHVELELINDGSDADRGPVDFLLEYKKPSGFVVFDTPPQDPNPKSLPIPEEPLPTSNRAPGAPHSVLGSEHSGLGSEYGRQRALLEPQWEKWDRKSIETALGEVEQFENRVAVAFSVRNVSGRPIEIVPPQIQIAGMKLKRNKKKGINVTADQLNIRDYKISSTRLEPGERVDGAVSSTGRTTSSPRKTFFSNSPKRTRSTSRS